MTILINPNTKSTATTNHEVDPTWIIISLAISISIFPFIVAMVFMTMNHCYLPLSSWAANLSGSGRNNNSNTSQRGRRASINGTGSGGGRHVKKTTMTMAQTTTVRDLLMLYQGLLSAGYLAFPMWMIYHSVGNTNSGDDDDGEGLAASSEGGVYSFVAILTVMGIICHNASAALQVVTVEKVAAEEASGLGS